MITLLTALLLASPVALAKKPPAHSVCPWSGPPPITAIAPDSVTVADFRYGLAKRKHMLAFQSLLQLCDAGDALPALGAWRAARGQVVARAAAAAAFATSASLRAIGADSAAEREKILEDAAIRATELAAEIAALTAVAKAKRSEFVLALQDSQEG